MKTNIELIKAFLKREEDDYSNQSMKEIVKTRHETILKEIDKIEKIKILILNTYTNMGLLINRLIMRGDNFDGKEVEITLDSGGNDWSINIDNKNIAKRGMGEWNPL